MTSRLKIIFPLLIVLAAAAWYWLAPHYSKEDEAYYVSVFCSIHHDDSSRFVADMRTVIEGGNSDYALQKIHFQPRLGEHVADAWQSLSAEQKAQVSADAAHCRSLLSAALD
ncbi:hypothetical protein BBB56_13590 [Candidatus Pantoea deserta]|uniref:Uncharacterized protein n=1 Tax=Candidatus Pantoea deserta TaxID=1869313 RepID=A0A3N4NTU8_9GAMM|nr:hypothetical protein [Pantoea deserta]RPD99185.1 hypothetical protein BBB56_13590 [Pantoea deserta]